jgi:hypothetical protein
MRLFSRVAQIVVAKASRTIIVKNVVPIMKKPRRLFIFLDFERSLTFSQCDMKLQPTQIERIVRNVFEALKARGVIEFKTPESQVLARAIELVTLDFKREDDLVKEVHKMMDDLEKQNPGGFDRGKMFPLLKAKLAKQKGIVL